MGLGLCRVELGVLLRVLAWWRPLEPHQHVQAVAHAGTCTLLNHHAARSGSGLQASSPVQVGSNSRSGLGLQASPLFRLCSSATSSGCGSCAALAHSQSSLRTFPLCIPGPVQGDFCAIAVYLPAWAVILPLWAIFFAPVGGLLILQLGARLLAAVV